MRRQVSERGLDQCTVKEQLSTLRGSGFRLLETRLEINDPNRALGPFDQIGTACQAQGSMTKPAFPPR